MSSDTYKEITNTILAKLEAGVKPWVQSFEVKCSGPTLPTRSNGDRYRGINVLMLWIARSAHGFTSNNWMTYKQSQELGGQVQSGSKGSLVIKYGTFQPSGANQDAASKSSTDADPAQIPYVRGYKVFNVNQIDNLPAQFYPIIEPLTADFRSMGRVEQLIDTLGAEIAWDRSRASYDRNDDNIQMPPRGSFRNEIECYSTLLHEVAHWTGAKRRLDRQLSGRFGKEAYAMEELIAEMSAAFLCGALGVEHEPGDNTASYIAIWVMVLKGDTRAIVSAAAKAQEVADYILNIEASVNEKAA